MYDICDLTRNGRQADNTVCTVAISDYRLTVRHDTVCTVVTGDYRLTVRHIEVPVDDVCQYLSVADE